jgi:hypothetical protein
VRIAGYTADSDHYCAPCAQAQYPARCSGCGAPGSLFDPSWHRNCPQTAARDPGYFQSFDGEGNEVTPFFDGQDDETDSFIHCGACGAFIGGSLTAEGIVYTIDALLRYATARAGAHGGSAEVLDQWREALRWYSLDRRDDIVMRLYDRRRARDLRVAQGAA